jgi:hypothetical protein
VRKPSDRVFHRDSKDQQEGVLTVCTYSLLDTQATPFLTVTVRVMLVGSFPT